MSCEQASPAHPLVHRHVNDPCVSLQVPWPHSAPLRHSFGLDPHRAPCHPGAHVQLYEPSVLLQLPPLKHGA